MFIGDREIESNKDGVIKYKDGSTETYSKEYAEYFTSKEAKTVGEFHEYKVHKIVSDAMKVFKEANATKVQINNYLETLKASVTEAETKALCIIYGTEFPLDINFSKINELALKYTDKYEKI